MDGLHAKVYRIPTDFFNILSIRDGMLNNAMGEAKLNLAAGKNPPIRPRPRGLAHKCIACDAVRTRATTSTSTIVVDAQV